MEKDKRKDCYTVDLLHVFKFILKRIWLVVICAVLAAGIGFSISAFAMRPLYSSSIMLYVNNGSASAGSGFSMSASQITAAQSLIKTYGEILNNRTTLERIIEKTGSDYKFTQLSDMISSEPSNGTEIMKVTVTSHDADEAAKIANCIAEVLPVRISEIINGASMEVVDTAIPNYQKVYPGITQNTMIGMLIGAVGSFSVLFIIALFVNAAHDEEHVTRNYKYPVHSKVSDHTDDNPMPCTYQSQEL